AASWYPAKEPAESPGLVAGTEPDASARERNHPPSLRRGSVRRLGRQTEEGRGLRPQTAEFAVSRVVLFHPLQALLIPLPGLRALAQAPGRHGQEEPVVGVAAAAELRRLGQRLAGGRPVAGPVVGP